MVEVRGGGFIDFLPRGPVTHFVGPSCTVIGCSYPRCEGPDAPQAALSPRKIVDRFFDRSSRVFAALAALNPLVSTQDFVVLVQPRGKSFAILAGKLYTSL